MAATSTNKQPCLVDRPLGVVVDLTGTYVAPGVAVDLTGERIAAKLVVDCTTNDGAIIEAIQDDPSAVLQKLGYLVNLYMCKDNQALSATLGYFVGSMVAGTDEGQVKEFKYSPNILAPVAQLGSEDDTEVVATYMRALYIPKGQCLWATAVAQYLKDDAKDPVVYAPLLHAQGGYY
jgi:hypothetical protein